VAVDVARVLERLGLTVRRHGARYWTEHCPLPTHGEPNPKHRWANFFVRTERGAYHCFSCKGGGRLLELVMVLKGIDEAAARAWLSEQGEAPGVPYVRVRYEPVGVQGTRFVMPAGVEHRPLAEWTDSPRRYLESRGVTADQVARWRIGVAFDGRLAHRIVVPTYDGRGRLANYAARTFVDAEVRYLSADEREHPDKSALWGEHLWPELAGRRFGIVFEGALNGLAIERALVPQAREGFDVPELLGLSGSKFDHRKAAKMATFRRLLVATDPDRAGDEVAAEIEGALRRRTEVVRFQYPRRGVDADALERDHPGELGRALRGCDGAQ
jgi:hypothetical protein